MVPIMRYKAVTFLFIFLSLGPIIYMSPTNDVKVEVLWKKKFAMQFVFAQSPTIDDIDGD